MNRVRYRVCSFIPDLLHPELAQPFALMVGSRDHFALIGIDLSTCELHDEHPMGAELIRRTFEVLWHRILAMLDSESIESGMDAVSRVGGSAPTNLYFSEVGETTGDCDDFRANAMSLFEREVAPATANFQCLSDA